MPTPQKLCCRVETILAHGEGVYTLELAPERPLPRFKPGQFLHLAVDPYDPSGFWPESRVFSIASSPLDREKIRLTYSVKGAFTARMENELGPGSQVWVKLPYGEFIITPDRPVVLFAGGTGVTAFTAFLAGLASDHPHPVTLFYGARAKELLVYRQQVEAQKGCQTYCFLEHFALLLAHELPGRTSVEAAWPLIQSPMQSSYYLSGPPPMLKALSADLQAKGIPTDDIHIDAWE